MKLLYDITILGRGNANANARAGIFRTIESVAEELIHQPECNMIFCSNARREDIALARNYLAVSPRLSKVPFSLPPNFNNWSRLNQRQINFNEKYADGWHNLPYIHRSYVNIRSTELKVRKKLFSKFDKKLLIHPRDLKNADIYHTHFYASFKGMKEAGVKSLFLTSYDIIPILYPQFCMDSMPQLMQSILDNLTPENWIVCISEATRNDLLNYMGNKLDPNKVSVTELAASHLFYQSKNKAANQLIRNKYGVPDAPYILSLCTLEPRKNIDQAIRAFVKIVQQENIPDLNLVLVGAKGWKFEKIFDTIKATEAVKRRIYITGYLADDDLAAMYSDALMFVYPTFYEGFGLPPLEAMQCGVPVITSNTSSLPEVVGDAGIMVPPTDLDELCQAMLSVYNNTLLRQQMIQKSLARAKQFSWKRCAEQTINAYKTSLQYRAQ